MEGRSFSDSHSENTNIMADYDHRGDSVHGHNTHGDDNNNDFSDRTRSLHDATYSNLTNMATSFLVTVNHIPLDNNATGNTTEDLDYGMYDYDLDDSLNMLPLREIIPVTIVYGLTLVIGVVGNSLVIFSIGRYRRMQNVTNIFLTSLASADLLLVLLCVPVKVLFSSSWVKSVTVYSAEGNQWRN